MELTLNIEGVEKTFDSGPVKFGVALKMIQLDKKIAERHRILVNGTENEVENEILKTDEYKEFCENAKLLVEFFDHQFTYEEFCEGYLCDSLQDFNELVIQMVGECKFGITNSFGGSESKK